MNRRAYKMNRLYHGTPVFPLVLKVDEFRGSQFIVLG
jgi:hypothetical protein